jgi:hypothetical protein
MDNCCASTDTRPWYLLYICYLAPHAIIHSWNLPLMMRNLTTEAPPT